MGESRFRSRDQVQLFVSRRDASVCVEWCDDDFSPHLEDILRIKLYTLLVAHQHNQHTVHLTMCSVRARALSHLSCPESAADGTISLHQE